MRPFVRLMQEPPPIEWVVLLHSLTCLKRMFGFFTFESLSGHFLPAILTRVYDLGHGLLDYPCHEAQSDVYNGQNLEDPIAGFISKVI